MWYLYTMEFYSATKNEILSFTSKWMELENFILSEVSQARLRRPKLTCSPSYADYRPETNAVILSDMGGIGKGRILMGGIGKGKETQNLNVVDVLTVKE
jgi:hypothetical protein